MLGGGAHAAESATVVVVGAGGREHALAARLAQSPAVARVLVVPGNAGTGALGGKLRNASVGDSSPAALAAFARDQGAALVVPGPEQPLVAGLADACRRAGVACFGPSAAAAQIEGSKAFSKAFMRRHGIPTAEFETFTDFAAASAYLAARPPTAVVIKASGLAAGKGVLLPETADEALAGLRSIMLDGAFGSAGNEVVIEERLDGEEVSVLAITDGYTVVPFLPAQDHKRVFEGDKGPNTGGMGAYAPAPIATSRVMREVQEKVLQPTIDGMRRDGVPYVGILYAGIMVTPGGIKVLEFNCRFGDPETQVVVPLLRDDCDLFEIMMAAAEHRLDSVKIAHRTGYAVTVVAASEGYPAAYPKGREISLPANVPQDTYIYHAGSVVDQAAEDDRAKVMTSGGRVLSVTGLGDTLEDALKRAYDTLGRISFEGMHYRRDIAWRALKHLAEDNREKASYAAAGVSIDAGNLLVQKIKPFVKRTRRLGSDADIGGFGGLFDMQPLGYRDPLLVAGTDGVGTKLKVAQAMGRHQTIGVDLVAMSVNDLLVQGAEPLLFLDYYACGKLDVDVAQQVVEGVAEGCCQARCALVGGETAEMPGMYQNGEYDLAGFSVGLVERDSVLPFTAEIKPGDSVLGLSSSGIHSNGYSLVRHILANAGMSYTSPCPFDPAQTIGEVLLTPTKIYVQALLPLVKNSRGLVKALAHITGGGFVENIPRVLGDDKTLGVEIDVTAWPLPPLFKWIKQLGNVENEELCRTLNCGIGMVVIVPEDQKDEVTAKIVENDASVRVYDMGRVVTAPAGGPQVQLRNLDKCW